MAAARAARADPNPQPPPRATVRVVIRPRRVPASGPDPGSGFRWDRAGRVVLLVVLVGIVGLYVQPLLSYWSTRHESQAKHNEVQLLKRENVRLKQRRTALGSKGFLEQEARRLGMVRPGERPFSVSGLPKAP